MAGVIAIGMVVLVIVAEYFASKSRPLCHWCNGRHFGRCIYNPRSGRIFANVNDGHFDVNDPNQ